MSGRSQSIFRASTRRASSYRAGVAEDEVGSNNDGSSCSFSDEGEVQRTKFKTPRSSRKLSRSQRSGSTQPDVAMIGGNLDPYECPVRDSDQDDSFVSDDGHEMMSPRVRVPQDGSVSSSEMHLSPRHAVFDRDQRQDGGDGGMPANATFLVPSDIHPNMIERDEDIAQLRLLAGKLSADWRGQDFMAPALARRIRDFQFAQEKRRRKYGDERPWGILGLYDHLAAIRVDVEWAEDASWRRANGEPYLSWADFNESKKRGINRPFFTYFLLFTCTVILIASIALNGWTVEPLDANPMIGPSAQTLIRMGAKESDLIVNHNEAWRLVSSTVLHAGLVHYFINVLALWFVGTAIERTHGFFAAMILFIIPAIGGTILSAIFLPEYITVGASGGIFGLIGACLSDITMNWKLLFSDTVNENAKRHQHAMVVIILLFDIILNSVIGLTPYVDNFTHLGGMMIGFLCGISTMERLSTDFFGVDQTCLSRTKQITIRFFGLIISIVGILVATIILLEGDGQTTPCPNCTWLSCVPFPPWNDYGDRWWYCDDCGRVTAVVKSSPSHHLAVDCPDGTNVAVQILQNLTRDELQKELPSYCREFCLA